MISFYFQGPRATCSPQASRVILRAIAPLPELSANAIVSRIPSLIHPTTLMPAIRCTLSSGNRSWDCLLRGRFPERITIAQTRSGIRGFLRGCHKKVVLTKFRRFLIQKYRLARPDSTMACLWAPKALRCTLATSMQVSQIGMLCFSTTTWQRVPLRISIRRHLPTRKRVLLPTRRRPLHNHSVPSPAAMSQPVRTRTWFPISEQPRMFRTTRATNSCSRSRMHRPAYKASFCKASRVLRARLFS